MKSGLVSIIIPTYNRASLLCETLNSVLLQTYTDWECIIIDDGSTDDTANRIAEYTARDPRFRYADRPKESIKGANTCRNYGFEISRGEFVNWFDSDDLMYPDFLEKRLTELLADPSLDFCACIPEIFLDSDPTIKTISPPQIYRIENFEADFLLNGFAMYTPSPLWRKRFLAGKWLFDTALYRSQEADFHFRMLACTPRFKYLSLVLYGIRTENESISSQSGTSIRAQQSIFTYFDRIFQSVLRNNPPNKSVSLHYIFYRQATTFYRLNTLSGGFKERTLLYSAYLPFFKNYLKAIDLSGKQTLKFYIGLFSVFFLGRGFTFFYFPEFDMRKNNQKQASRL